MAAWVSESDLLMENLDPEGMIDSSGRFHSDFAQVEQKEALKATGKMEDA